MKIAVYVEPEFPEPSDFLKNLALAAQEAQVETYDNFDGFVGAILATRPDPCDVAILLLSDQASFVPVYLASEMLLDTPLLLALPTLANNIVEHARALWPRFISFPPYDPALLKAALDRINLRRNG